MVGAFAYPALIVGGLFVATMAVTSCQQKLIEAGASKYQIATLRANAEEDRQLTDAANKSALKAQTAVEQARMEAQTAYAKADVLQHAYEKSEEFQCPSLPEWEALSHCPVPW